MRLQSLPRLAIAAGWLLLAPLAIQHHRSYEDGLQRAEAYAGTFTLDQRRPEAVETVRWAMGPDLAYTPVVDAALEDATGSVSLRSFSPEEADLWIAAAGRLTEELEASRNLLLDAVAARPGWAYHPFLLGQAVYVEGRRLRSPALAGRPDLWLAPLRLAMRLAPEDPAPGTFLAGALLETWASLPEEARREAPAVIEAAFHRADFVGRSFPVVCSALGAARAEKMLADEPAPLGAAFEAVKRAGELGAAVRLRARWEVAERAARERALSALEGEDATLRAASCRRFLQEHPPRLLDDAQGRSQAGRLLAAWPSDGSGAWSSDPRGDFARYFLEGRLGVAGGDALLRLTGPLTGIPEVEKARMLLHAGDQEGWRRVVEASATRGGFEWTRFQVELARSELKRGAVKPAAAALDAVAPRAKEECDVLLARRLLARARGDAAGAGAVQALIDRLPREFVPEMLAGGRTLSVCVDPERGERLQVPLRTRMGELPSLLAFGWDGGLAETRLVGPGEATLDVPLQGLEGRRVFSFSVLAGGAVDALGARLSAAPAESPAAAQETPSSTASVAGIAGRERLNSTRP